jgi:hypothetical protein
MSLREWFTIERLSDDWEGICRRCDRRAQDDHREDIGERLSLYLLECYVSRPVLQAALQRSINEHSLGIRLAPRLPKKEHIRKMAFGEALCLLLFREEDGFWAPLDKLGEGNPSPEGITPGIDVLAFHLSDSEGSYSIEHLYVFEVKTTSDRTYVKTSIAHPKKGMLTFFNEKLALRNMVQDEINLILKKIGGEDGQQHFAQSLLMFYNMPLQERKQREHYCPMFVLDADLGVEDHLRLLQEIKHPAPLKWLHVMRFAELDEMVADTFQGATTLAFPGK